MPRILSALAALLLALLTFTVAPAAVAAPYGPQTGAATVSATVIPQGGTVTVSGGGFCARSLVFVIAGPNVVRVVGADRRGHAAARLRLFHLGDNTLRLAGRQTNCAGARLLTAHVRVVPARHHRHHGVFGGLPHTGGTGLTPLWAGMGLLAAGSLLVTVAHKRRRIVLDPA